MNSRSSQEDPMDRHLNNILNNLYSDSSNSDSQSVLRSELSHDERYLIDEVDCLSKTDFKKLKKCRVGDSKSKCTVCLEGFEKNQIIRILPCHHKFHDKCTKPWFKKSVFCPLCRFDVKKHFHPETKQVPNTMSVNSETRNPLLDVSFIQPRYLTPMRTRMRQRNIQGRNMENDSENRLEFEELSEKLLDGLETKVVTKREMQVEMADMEEFTQKRKELEEIGEKVENEAEHTEEKIYKQFGEQIEQIENGEDQEEQEEETENLSRIDFNLNTVHDLAQFNNKVNKDPFETPIEPTRTQNRKNIRINSNNQKYQNNQNQYNPKLNINTLFQENGINKLIITEKNHHLQHLTLLKPKALTHPMILYFYVKNKEMNEILLEPEID